MPCKCSLTNYPGKLRQFTKISSNAFRAITPLPMINIFLLYSLVYIVISILLYSTIICGKYFAFLYPNSVQRVKSLN